VLLMSTKSQVLSMSFRTQGRVDVEPPSVADSLRECAASSPRAWQAEVDNDIEDEVVEIFFSSSYPNSLCNSLALLHLSIHMYVRTKPDFPLVLRC
jgi:hypothetical protein